MVHVDGEATGLTHELVTVKTPGATEGVAVIVNGSEPLLVSVALSVVPVDPTTVLPKFRVAGERVPSGIDAGTPAPDRVTVCGLPLALSVRFSVAAKFPVAVGAKVTEIVQFASVATLPHVPTELEK
jgi:hypothetical protein